MNTPSDLRAGVLLDLDGTLVDSVYQHVAAWHETFRAHGYEVPQWRIHAGIGMGSDRIVPWLLGGHVEDAHELAKDHTRRFLTRADLLRPTEGALELLEDLERRGVAHLISTSANAEEREALFDALGRHDLESTDADDVDSSKPASDLLLSACEQGGIDSARAIMVGDAPWDAYAAHRARIRAFSVRCGGFGDAALTAAGAARVVDAPRDLIGQL